MSDPDIDLTGKVGLSPKKGAGLDALKERGATVPPPPPPVVDQAPQVAVAAVEEKAPAKGKASTPTKSGGKKAPAAKPQPRSVVADAELIGSMIKGRRVLSINIAVDLREAVDNDSKASGRTIGDTTLAAVRTHHTAVREASAADQVDDGGFAQPRVTQRQSSGVKKKTTITVSDDEARALMQLGADTAKSVTLVIEECLRLQYEKAS